MLRYASGPYRPKEAEAGSTFSRGDVLCYDSNSSLSRLPTVATASVRIAGVATADSTQSINRKCVYIIPTPATHFWSDCTVSQFTAGERLDLQYDAVNRRGFYVENSQNTVLVATITGTVDVNSNRSEVRVRFIGSGGSLAHS